LFQSRVSINKGITRHVSYTIQINKTSCLPHLLCVGGISIAWFSKELKNDLSNNNWLRGIILILLVRESIFVRWGFPFPIVLVPRYKLSLYHSYQTWLIGFPGIWCLCVWVTWLCVQEVRITSTSQLHPLLYLGVLVFSFYSSKRCYWEKNLFIEVFFYGRVVIFLMVMQKLLGIQFVWLKRKGVWV